MWHIFHMCGKRLLWKVEKPMGSCPQVIDLVLTLDVRTETKPGRMSAVEQGPVITWEGGPAISWG